MAKKQKPEEINNQQLKEEVKALLIEDRYTLIMRQPFIGRLATFLNLIPICDSRIDIACTDGTSIYVNAKYYKSLSEEERLGIIAHEVWHCALRHFARRGNRDRKKFNYATDIEVDLLLTSAGFKIEILPFDPDWAGRSAEEIYELINEDNRKILLMLIVVMYCRISRCLKYHKQDGYYLVQKVYGLSL